MSRSMTRTRTRLLVTAVAVAAMLLVVIAPPVANAATGGRWRWWWWGHKPRPTATAPTTPPAGTPTLTPTGTGGPTPTDHSGHTPGGGTPTGATTTGGAATGVPYDPARIPAGSAGVGFVNVRNTGERPGVDPDGIGAFRTVCGYSHMRADDPIVKPNAPGTSHLHTFWGNTATNAHSTAESIASTGNSTCRGGTVNRTAYWTPSIIDTRTGTPVAPSSSTSTTRAGTPESSRARSSRCRPGCGWWPAVPWPPVLSPIWSGPVGTTAPARARRS